MESIAFALAIVLSLGISLILAWAAMAAAFLLLLRTGVRRQELQTVAPALGVEAPAAI